MLTPSGTTPMTTSASTSSPTRRSAVSLGTALRTGAVVMWTMLGAIIGAVGWRLIVNRSARSRGLLNTLVPTVLVLSLVPDVALLATDSVAGQTTAGVVALMVMHVVTAVIAVTAYRKVMPAG